MNEPGEKPLPSIEDVVATAGTDPNSPAGWRKAGMSLLAYSRRFTDPSEKLRVLEQASEMFSLAVALAPTDPGLLIEWGRALESQAKACATSSDTIRLLQEAAQCFLKAQTIAPGSADAAFRLGRNFFAQASATSDPAQKRDLLRQACECHQVVSSIDPRLHENLADWGRALNQQGHLADGESQVDLYRQSAGKYEQAACLQPQDYFYRLFGAYCHLSLARLAPEPSRADAFKFAAERFAAASVLRPDHPGAIGEEGVALFEWSKRTQDEPEGAGHLQQAVARLTQATQLKPDSGFYFLFLGRALEKLSEITPAGERGELPARAEEAFDRAWELRPEDSTGPERWARAVRKRADLLPLPERIELYRSHLQRLVEHSAQCRNDEGRVKLWATGAKALSNLLEDPEQFAELQRQAELFASRWESGSKAGSWHYARARALREISCLFAGGSLQTAILEAAESSAAAAVLAEPERSATHALHADLLTDLAAVVEMPRKAELYRQALASHATVAALNPADHGNLVDWGGALWDLGRHLGNEERAEASKQAQQRFAEAAALKSEDGNVFHQWGFILYWLAEKAEPGNGRSDLYLDSLEKLENAIRLDPARMLTHYYKGKALSGLARDEEDPAQQENYDQRSIQCLKKAIELDSGWATSHATLGDKLSDLAGDTTDPAIKIQLYVEAEQFYATATTLDPGVAWHFDHADEMENVDDQIPLLLAARDQFIAALELNPDRSGFRHHLANTFSMLGDAVPEPERLNFYDQALEHYAAVLPDSNRWAAVLRNWAETLSDKASVLSDKKESCELLHQAVGLCEQAVTESEGSDARPFRTWGNCFMNLAFAQPGDAEEQAAAFFASATEKFTQAFRLDPKSGGTASQVALSLSCRAIHVDSSLEKVRLLRQAVRYREIAAKLVPGDASNYYWWGRALWRLSQLAGGDASSRFRPGEREQLLIRSSRLYAKSVRLNPTDSDAWLDWARVLLERSENGLDFSARSDLQQRARRNCRRVIALGERAHRGWFMLSRIEAVAGDASATVEALENWKKLAPRARLRDVRKCSDFDQLEGNPIFEDFLRSWDEA